MPEGLCGLVQRLFSALTKVCKHAWRIMRTLYVLTGGLLTLVPASASQKPARPVYKAKTPALNPQGPWQMQGPLNLCPAGAGILAR